MYKVIAIITPLSRPFDIVMRLSREIGENALKKCFGFVVAEEVTVKERLVTRKMYRNS